MRSSNICSRPLACVLALVIATGVFTPVGAVAQTKTKTETVRDFSELNTGDTFCFGSYEQDNDLTNGKEPIEWIIMSKSKNKLMVVSKYVLDCRSFNTKSKDVTWEDCSLRSWLNKDFYESAFSEEEKSLIRKNKLRNRDNPEYGTEGGNTTKDRVFLLSIDDIGNKKYGFGDPGDKAMNRRCAATAYAIAQGVYVEDYYTTADGEPTCWWWLRSPGYYEHRAAGVNGSGCIDSYGERVTGRHGAVRPALILRCMQN